MSFRNNFFFFFVLMFDDHRINIECMRWSASLIREKRIGKFCTEAAICVKKKWLGILSLLEFLELDVYSISPKTLTA